MPDAKLLTAHKSLSVQVIEATTANGVCTMRIKAVALPGAVATALDENADLIRMTLASSSSAPTSVEQSTAELAPNIQAAEGDNHTDTAIATATDTDANTNTDTDTKAIEDMGSLEQHQPSRSDSALDGTASALDTGGAGDPSTAAGVLGSSGRNLANGNISSSSGTAYKSCTHGSENGSSVRIDNTAGLAEDASDAGRVEAPPPGPGNPSLGSGTESRGGLQGTQGKNSKEEANHSIGRVKAAAAPVDSADQQSEEEGQSIASGKVGILKQRLLAAVKEAKADSPALLQVILQKCFALPALLL